LNLSISRRAAGAKQAENHTKTTDDAWLFLELLVAESPFEDQPRLNHPYDLIDLPAQHLLTA
jgi:hypothetical protein